jgi:gamma-glutamyltranspeptidase/glutathione hydrolase
VHRQIEAVKLAFTDGLKYIADPAYMSVGSKELLSPEYASARRALIKKNAIVSQPGSFGDHGTVYLATADGEGNMVSYIQSNYLGFGSGLVVPGTGIALHNRGANFSLDPQAPTACRPANALTTL